MTNNYKFIYVLLIKTMCIAIVAQSNSNINLYSTKSIAPIAIQMDAITTLEQVTSSFSGLHYRWDFGDCIGNQWTHSNKPKNSDTAPVAAHLYTQPGTYIVNLKTKAETDVESSQSVSITVQDPNQVFAGSQTICFSKTGNFADAPADALQITTSQFTDVMNALGTGKRVLLRRGESWTTNEGYVLNEAGPSVLGAYGIGAAPIINHTSSEDLFTLSGSTPLLQDWTFMDLELRSTNGSTAAFRSAGYHSDLAFYNLKIDGFTVGIEAIMDSIEVYDQAVYQNLSIVECEISNIKGSGYGVHIGAENFTFLGNHLHTAENGAQLVKAVFLDKAVISHNRFEQGAMGQPLLQIHAGNYNDNTSVLHQRYTQNVVISNNLFFGGANEWNVAIGPQGASNLPSLTYDERVRNVLIEKNFFKASASTTHQLVLNAQEISVRNNLFNNTASTDVEGNTIRIFQRSVEPVPDNIQVYHNTVVRLGDNNTRLIDARPLSTQSNPQVATNIQYINNLLYAPDATASLMLPATNPSHIGSHNETNPVVTDFKGTNFEHWEDFQLVDDASVGINMGKTLPVYDAFDDEPRVGLYDIGAFETIETSIQPIEPTYGIQPSDTEAVILFSPVLEARPDTTVLLGLKASDFCYEWNFGDSQSGDWTYSTRPQNTATGLVAGHFYTQPGTYTAVLTTSDGEGNSTEHAQTITIADPDLTFAGNQTICISQTGDFTNAPTGAKLLTTTNFGLVIASLTKGKRILLKSGESWAIQEGFTINVEGPIILGTFGSGDAPILNVNLDNGVFLNLSGSTPNLHHATFQGLDIRTSGTNTIAFEAQGTCHGLYFHQINLDGFYKGFHFSPSLLERINQSGEIQHALYQNITISECTITNIQSGGVGIYAAAKGFICTGNRIDNAHRGQLAIVLPIVQQALIAHNQLSNPAALGNLLQIQTDNLDAITSIDNHSADIVIAHNDFQGELNEWNMVIGAGNNASHNNIERVTIEKNFFKGGTNNVGHIQLQVQNAVIQNNLFNLSSTTNPSIAIQVAPKAPLPDFIHIYNNTAVDLDNAAFTFIDIDTVATTIDYCNNLVYTPNTLESQIISDATGMGDCGTNHLVTSNPGFQGTDFNTTNSFNLSCTGELVSEGTPILLCDDFSGNKRAISTAIGALSCTETDCLPSLEHTGTLAANTYRVEDFIRSSATINAQTSVTYQAGNYIQLNPGFHVAAGSNFHALIADCAAADLEENNAVTVSAERKFSSQQLIVAPNPFHQSTTIQVVLQQDANIQLSIYDLNGRLLEMIAPLQHQLAGVYHFTYIPHQLASGVYLCVLTGDEGRKIKKLVFSP